MKSLTSCILLFLSLTKIFAEQACNAIGQKTSTNNLKSYKECINGTWRIKYCPKNEIYDVFLFECIHENFPFYDAETRLNLESTTENYEEGTISHITENLETTQYEMYNMSQVDEITEILNNTETDKNSIDVLVNTTQSIIEKSISNDGSILQELKPSVKFNTGPIVKTQTTKTKANWTTTVLNGEALYTDISVYQSHGRSYQFRIPGSLPQEIPEGIIAWIRENSNKYPQTDIEYVEYGNNVEKYLYPPSELPVRCGLKFLEKLSGGKASPIEENPWQVAVIRKDTEGYICGGAVITRRHVLSAAHCFKRINFNYAAHQIILRVGDYDKEVREESQYDYQVVELTIHPEYHEKSHLHDIALLTTNEDIPFSSNVYPICLPPPWAEYVPGIVCTVSGWGQVEADSIPTRYLRSGEVSIVSRDDCRKKTIFSKGVPIEIFCAEDPTKKGVDTCLGDSGGPFACSNNGTFYLYGITAFGSYPCGQDIPSFYTNVSFYKLWILHLLSKNSSNTTEPTYYAL